MKKLLKETWRSLQRNKFTILLLGIVTLLVSAVLTTLFNVRASYIKQYNELKTVSRLPDYTVDLDLNATGTTPSSGVYTKTSQTYLLTDPTVATKRLSFSGNYVALNSLIETNDDRYILTSDLLAYFNGTKSSQNIVVDKEVDTITFNDNHTFVLHTKIGNAYTINTTDYTISPTTEFTFDDTYFLRDVANLNLKNSGADFLSNVGAIYLNARTKVATLSVATSNQWSRNKELITVESENLASLLGYELASDGYYYYTDDNASITINNQFIDNDVEVLNYASTFSGSFNLNYLTADMTHTTNSLYILDQGTVFAMPSANIVSYQPVTEYVKNHYEFNYNDGEGYSGVYTTVAKAINDGSGYQSLKSGFYWEKITYDLNDGVESNRLSSVLNNDDLTVSIVADGSTESTTIFNLESLSQYNELELISQTGVISDISVPSKLQTAFETAAVANLRNDVVSQVVNYSGTSNAGYRQTGTVSTLVEDAQGESQSYTYLFVNTGVNHVVANVETNVGRLLNDSQTNKLNQGDSSNSDFIKTEYIGSAAAFELVLLTLEKNMYVDPNYLKVKITYEPVQYTADNLVINETAQKTIQIVNSKDTTDVLGVSYFVLNGTQNWLVSKKIDGIWQGQQTFLRGTSSDELQTWMINNSYTLDATHNGSWAKIEGDKVVIPVYLTVIKQDAVVELARTGTLTNTA